jgi:protein phosphatase
VKLMKRSNDTDTHNEASHAASMDQVGSPQQASDDLDIVGDIHGCHVEFCSLLEGLGYQGLPRADDSSPSSRIYHPSGRKIILTGDLVDRGPDPVSVLSLAIRAWRDGVLLGVRGNHDDKLIRALKGNPVTRNHGLAETMQALEATTPEFRVEVLDFLERLPSHLVLQEGKLVVAHAGIKEKMIGKPDKEVWHFCLYGAVVPQKTPGEAPVRKDWAQEYQGAATIVHGHTPMLSPRRLRNVVCIDTGCCFGNALTAFRWPEETFVSVPSRQIWSRPTVPLEGAPEPEGVPSDCRPG